MNSNKLATKLRELRKAKKLTQAQLAAASKVSQGTIGNIEAGLRGYGESLVDIARALDVTPAFLRDEHGSDSVEIIGTAPLEAVPTENRKLVNAEEIARLIVLYQMSPDDGRQRIMDIAIQSSGQSGGATRRTIRNKS